MSPGAADEVCDSGVCFENIKMGLGIVLEWLVFKATANLCLPPCTVSLWWRDKLHSYICIYNTKEGVWIINQHNCCTHIVSVFCKRSCHVVIHSVSRFCQAFFLLHDLTLFLSSLFPSPCSSSCRGDGCMDVIAKLMWLITLIDDSSLLSFHRVFHV